MRKQFIKTILCVLFLFVIFHGIFFCICINNAKQANVLIETKIFGIFGEDYAIGSGVVISSDGFIVTAKHVIEDANEIRITTSNGEIYAVENIYIDNDSDLAIIDADCENVNFVTIQPSTDLKWLDIVFGIGNSRGLFDADFSFGWIYKNPFKRMFFEDNEMLMVNMTIKPGCSGGGLYRYDKLVGIMTNSAGDYSFSVSSNEIIKFLQENEIAL